MNVRLLRHTATLLSALVASASASFAQLTRTPETTEGPYYIFNSTQRLDTTWLVNADNDLTQVGTSTTRASGTPLLLSGQLVNLSGAPVAGATIEIWQTDNNGLYYHSGNNYQARDQNFQFFGTSVTDANGNYSFRTVRPGLYTGRIRHIHFKIKLNGTTLVTSQLMFEEDRAQFTTDMVAAQLGSSINLVLINPVTGTDSSGASVLVATRQLVVNATGSATSGAPAITTQPASASVSAGDTVTFSVVASSTTAVSYQWQKDGAAISGATSATYTLNSVTTTTASAGSYTVVVTNAGGSTTSNVATLAVMNAGTSSSSALVNLSVRSYLPSASASLTAGFVIQSASGKRMLVRAIGPALTSFGVANALSDPRVEIYDASSNKMAENDSWDSSLSTMFAQLGAFALPAGSKDAALTVTLPAGAGTAHVRGTDAGVALVEAYDTASSSASRLVNLSARSTVGAADSMLIAGFVIQGTGTKRLLIRAVGPKLAELGVTGALADPKREIFNAAGTVASNDDWPAALAATFTQAAAFALNSGSKDAAVVVTLPAGASYTAVVSGVNGATGEALVEIYDLQ